MKLLISPDGKTVHGMHDHIVDGIQGKQFVKRLSSVEFSHLQQEWIAEDLRTNKIIARGKTRSEVLDAEQKYYEKNLVQYIGV
jgi:hypothetical protein